MTDEEAQAIAARASKATPGPWLFDADARELYSENDAATTHTVAWDMNMADAAFIAHARADIPALLAEVEASREIVRAVAAARPHGRSVVYFHPPLLPDGQTLEGYSDNIIQLDAVWCEKARALLGDEAGDGEVSR